MDEALQHLGTLLQEELNLHQALRAELEQEVAQDGKHGGAALLKVQQRKQHLVRRVQKLEQRRLELVRSLAKAWQQPAEKLTLRRIIPRAPAPLAETLRGLHAALLQAVGEIRDLAKTSAGNAQARLTAVDATLAVVHEAVKVHATYSDAGRLQAKPVTIKYTSA